MVGAHQTPKGHIPIEFIHEHQLSISGHYHLRLLSCLCLVIGLINAEPITIIPSFQHQLRWYCCTISTLPLQHNPNDSFNIKDIMANISSKNMTLQQSDQYGHHHSHSWPAVNRCRWSVLLCAWWICPSEDVELWVLLTMPLNHPLLLQPVYPIHMS